MQSAHSEHSHVRPVKWILAALAVLLFFLAVDAIRWYSSPESLHYTQSGSVQVLPGSSVSDTSGLEPFRSVVFRFAQPMKKDSLAILYYAGKNGVTGSLEQSCLKGTPEITFLVPYSGYLSLECFIHPEPEIVEVSVSDSAAERLLSGYTPSLRLVLLPAAAVLLLALLFAYVRPLNRLLHWLDRRILDPETRWTGITWGYAAFAFFMLFHHIYVTLYHKNVLTGATGLSLPLLIFAAVSFLLGRLWKDRLSWVLLLLLFVKIARDSLLGRQTLESDSSVFVMSAYAFFGCYAVGRVLRPKDWKTFLSVFCLLWTLAVAVYSAFGLYTAVTGIPVPNLNSEQFTITTDSRLQLIYYPVVCGILLSTSTAVCFLGCSLSRFRSLRFLYVLAAVLFFVTGSQTGTRTAYLLSGIELALLLCLWVYNRLKPDVPGQAAASAGKWALLVLLFAAAAGAVAFLQSYTLDAFQLIRTRGGLIPRALAEAGFEADEISHRGFVLSVDPDITLAGRLEVWKNVLHVIFSGPKNLLLGQSVHDPMPLVNEIRSSAGLYAVHHCHNAFLQTMLENGLPGLLLLLSFFCAFLFHAVRVLFDRSLPFWQRLIPIPAIGCLIGDLADITCHVSAAYPPMTLLYLFAGFTIALGRRSGRKKTDQR